MNYLIKRRLIVRCDETYIDGNPYCSKHFLSIALSPNNVSKKETIESILTEIGATICDDCPSVFKNDSIYINQGYYKFIWAQMPSTLEPTLREKVLDAENKIANLIGYNPSSSKDNDQSTFPNNNPKTTVSEIER